MSLLFLQDIHFPIFCSQVSTLASLGQVQTEEDQPDDAVKTYMQILHLQAGEDPDEVADAHFQASASRLTMQACFMYPFNASDNSPYIPHRQDIEAGSDHFDKQLAYCEEHDTWGSDGKIDDFRRKSLI